MPLEIVVLMLKVGLDSTPVTKAALPPSMGFHKVAVLVPAAAPKKNGSDGASSSARRTRPY